ncbi:hypothetical protein PUN28_010748 [Cardiocondyla obscurior]|uniref:Uncharacterized protein n=1 Tax=Cardiocondyla obscurior TaxID=286306 RepID=A0AAW2FMR0_9HYME
MYEFSLCRLTQLSLVSRARSRQSTGQQRRNVEMKKKRKKKEKKSRYMRNETPTTPTRSFSLINYTANRRYLFQCDGMFPEIFYFHFSYFIFILFSLFFLETEKGIISNVLYNFYFDFSLSLFCLSSLREPETRECVKFTLTC